VGWTIGHGIANSRVRAFKCDYEHIAVFRQFINKVLTKYALKKLHNRPYSSNKAIRRAIDHRIAVSCVRVFKYD
jgi:hypothetical protein